jgi:hypothetical protein
VAGRAFAAARSARASAISARLFNMVGFQPNLVSTAMIPTATTAPKTTPGIDWTICVGLSSEKTPSTISE